MSMSVNVCQCPSMSVNVHVRFDSTPDDGHCGRAPPPNPPNPAARMYNVHRYAKGKWRVNKLCLYRNIGMTTEIFLYVHDD